MENKVISNVTNTIAVIGLSATLLGTTNTLQVQSIKPNQIPNIKTNNRKVKGCFDTISFKQETINKNCYIDEQMSRLERESLSLFGVMRDATKEEQEGVQKYIDSIAEDTGVSFFDIC